VAQFQRRPNTFIPFEANQYVNHAGLVLGMKSREDGSVYVKTIQGRDVDVSPGEWIIQEPDGEHFYPCADSVFRERYEPSQAQ
jgi:hypothetical protein